MLASDGQKMSKSKKNFPDPKDVINKYGADSIRLYLITSPAVRGDSVKFSEAGVKDVIKDAFLPWYNACKFMLQNIERWEADNGRSFVYKEILTYEGDNVMDKWLLSSIQSLLKFVRNEMAQYKLYTVLPRLVKFIDTLCNWYVRLNRRRIKGETGSDDCFLALNTLFNVLFTMLRLCAAFVPFLTESLYQRIRKYLGENSQKVEYASIHFLQVPEINEKLIHTEIEKLVGTMQKIILLGRVIRERKVIPLRHPLKELVVVVEDYEDIGNTIVKVRPYIFEELNVKELKITKKREEYGIEMKAKPNFSVLAVKAKDKMRVLSAKIESMTDAQIQQLRDDGKYVIEDFELVLDDIKILPKIDAARFSQYEADFDENVLFLKR